MNDKGSLMLKILLGFVIILIVMQFFQPVQNLSKERPKAHLEELYILPLNVKGILAQSCYDCHSNNTKYPWYSRIQPGAWFMERHIRKGKEELNFSNFGNYSLRKQRNMFRSMAGQVKKDEMPLSSYTLIHRNATLSQKEKQALIKWFDAMADSVK